MAIAKASAASGLLILRAGKLQAHHVQHLCLIGVTDPYHRLLDLVGRVFAHAQPGLRRHQHRDAARLPQLERPGPVLVDKGLFHRSLIRRKPARPPPSIADAGTAGGSAKSAPTETHNPIGHMRDSAPRQFNDAPAEVTLTPDQCQLPAS